MEAYGDAEVRGDRWVAVALSLAFLTLYALTLCRVVFWYDSAEYVTAAVTLGIPHPPGYPLYTLVAHAFTWLPVDAALAVNGMSAVFAAIAVGFTYLVARLLGIRRLSSAVGAATLGGSKLFWINALVAEVYCPALAVIALVLYLLLRGRRESRFTLVLIAAFVAGLGLGVHLSIATLGLGMALLVWSFGLEIESPRQLACLVDADSLAPRIRRLLASALAAFGGSLIFLYLPFRAAQGPPLNFGNPSSLERFGWVVSGGNYKSWFSERLDVGQRGIAILAALQEQFLLLGLALAAAGLVWLWHRRRVECLAILLMITGNIGFFFRYQVHDLAVFFLPTTLLASVLVAAGAQALLETVARLATPQRRIGMVRLSQGALIGFAVVLVVGNYRSVDMSEFRETEKFMTSIIETLPINAVVLNYTTPPEWQRDAVFGMYVQKVLMQRTDVDVVTPRGPETVLAALDSGRPVYAYAPVAPLAQRFVLAPSGPVFRVLGPLRTSN